MKPPLLTPEDLIRLAPSRMRAFHENYFAMYSSVFGGIITDPAWMLVPADDHLVHRGDGVFETLKFLRGHVYNLHAHLDRLAHSAKSISLHNRWSRDELTTILLETVRASGKQDGLIRIILARGPGSLGVNPYDCPETALYIVISQLARPIMEVKPGGISMAPASIPAREDWLAAVKTCNYLPNVLMKKEAVDLGVDFVAGLDHQSCLTESATESIAIVLPGGQIKAPPHGKILEGTTMTRVFELARQQPYPGFSISRETISHRQLLDATEILVIGTTHDVAAVINFDGRPVGTGKPGPVFHHLSNLLRHDLLHGPLRHAVN